MADRLLKYDVAMKSTKTVWQMETPRCYTGDENTVTFDFNITDLEAADLVGVIPNVYLYMRDGSFFQNGPADGVEITGTIVNYTMKGNEGKHSGIARAQLVLVWDDEINPPEKLTSQLYNFEVVSGLENKVDVEVMIQDWTTLTREARTFIDTSSDEVDALKAELQTAINTANASLGEFDVALETGIVAANLAEKLEDFEEINNSRLLSTEQQLADIAKSIVCFNFDDGLAADSLTYTIFKEYGYPASFGLITDTLYNTNKNSLNNYKDYEKDGFEILSHSSSHAYLDTAKSDAVKYRELQVSADKLRELGFSANGFIAPYSTIEATNLAYAKNVYDYILVGGTGLNGKNGFKKKTITRVSAIGSGVVGCKALIDQAISDNQLLIFYDHAVGAVGSLTEAEWREILTYVQNRMAYNYMEVHNLKNAIAKYYGIATPDRSKKLNEYNQAPSINSPSWILENNTAVATKFADVNFANETLRITIPNGAAIGTSFSLANTITLPASLESLGERTRFGIKLKLGNSQYTYFDKFLDVSYLDSSGTVLLTKSKQIYPDTTFGDNYYVDIYPEYPLVPKDIVKIKIAVRFAVTTSPTVAHQMYLSDVKLNFPLFKDKITSAEISFTNITGATPDVTNKKYLYVNNASTTTITNLLTDHLSQEVTLIFGNANTTISGNNLIRLSDGLDLTPKSGSVLTLIKFGSFSSAWYEKSRAIRTV